MMRNDAYLDNKIIEDVFKSINLMLPKTWSIKYISAPQFIDVAIELSPPNEMKKIIAVVVKSQLDPKNVADTMSNLRNQDISDAILIAAPYLSQRTRERIIDAGANYIDMTGNVFIKVDQPVIYIEKQGANKNIWRTKRQSRSLKGVQAANIVRALCDYKLPLGVRELATLTQTDPGYVSRILELLEREDLITRSNKGAISSVDWVSLIRTWTKDYSLLEYNNSFSYIDPRGIENFLKNLKLPDSNLNFYYAITGSLSASRIAPIAPTKMAICFVDNQARAATSLNLIPTDTGANILLVEPKADFVFLRTRVDDGINYTALSQTTADLLTGPGRNPSEGEALIEWMKDNEDAWRT